MTETLHFRVSSGLKNIIGRELINDKYIAIFELVKNSYDAGASKVVLTFENLKTKDARIIVNDDGKGMNKDDIINKWLFVAYSEKRNPSYRDKIKRTVAGAKGVGRFSCDRLGECVVLKSKTKNETYGHKILINWNDFEEDSLDNFSDISVAYDIDNSCQKNGTSIEISSLREIWTRSDLIALKKSLTQLVNPSATSKYDTFKIELCVPEELENDVKEKEERNKVNGKITNNIFDILSLKTTKIHVEISEDGKTITTQLNDRGVMIFKTVEKNEFSLHGIKSVLFYLNPIAKTNFTRLMGVQPINYGSVFVYRNGFRVFPYGEPGKDFFDMDQRKTQGYRRYLGTREVMGQIEIDGHRNNLVETSSRNNGFIATPQLDELKNFYVEYLLKPLEKYVVNIVHWGNAESFYDDYVDNQAFNSIPDIVAKIKNNSKLDTFIDVQCNDNLKEILGEYKRKENSVITDLKKIALQSENEELIKKTKEIEKQTKKLEKEKREAEEAADVSREYFENISNELRITQNQVGVLVARANLTAKDAIDAMHIIKGYADALDSVVAEIYEIFADNSININPIKDQLSDISRICEKIVNSYNLVMRTQYSANNDSPPKDIIEFIKEYTEQISQPVSIYMVYPENINSSVKFNPLEFSIIIDNIISNSKKANANALTFSFEQRMDELLIRCSDDGYGISKKADVSKIFEAGYTTTVGTGIGMSTVKKYIEKYGGRVEINSSYKNGFELVLYLKLWI